MIFNMEMDEEFIRGLIDEIRESMYQYREYGISFSYDDIIERYIDDYENKAMAIRRFMDREQEKRPYIDLRFYSSETLDYLFLLQYDPDFIRGKELSRLDKNTIFSMYLLSGVAEEFNIDSDKREMLRDILENDSYFCMLESNQFVERCRLSAMKYTHEYTEYYFQQRCLNNSTNLKRILEFAETVTDNTERRILQVMLFNIFTPHGEDVQWINDLKLPVPAPEPWAEEIELLEKNDGGKDLSEKTFEKAWMRLPENVRTQNLRVRFMVLQEENLLNEALMPGHGLTNAMIANMAYWIADREDITKVWAVFSKLWNKNADSMRNDYNRSKKMPTIADFRERLKATDKKVEEKLVAMRQEAVANNDNKDQNP